MEPLGRLLSTDSRETLQFFFTELRDATAEEHADERAVLYNASVLAHFALTSSGTTAGMPAPTTLVDVFDRFVLHPTVHKDPELMEEAASQCLLLTGFFGDQLRTRFNLNWYGQLGSSFYRVAAATSHVYGHRRMMAQMADRFDYWRGVHQKLARELRTSRYSPL